MQWYHEKQVKNRLLNWLDSTGHTESIPQTDQLHGVDIQRRNKEACRYWFIECKGFPSETYQKSPKKGQQKSKKRISSQRYSWFTRVIGQISLRMKQEHGYYGIGLPNVRYYRNKIMNIHIFRKRAKIHFFLIGRNGDILQIKPDEDKAKKIF